MTPASKQHGSKWFREVREAAKINTASIVGTRLDYCNTITHLVNNATSRLPEPNTVLSSSRSKEVINLAVDVLSHKDASIL